MKIRVDIQALARSIVQVASRKTTTCDQFLLLNTHVFTVDPLGEKSQMYNMSKQKNIAVLYFILLDKNVICPLL